LVEVVWIHPHHLLLVLVLVLVLVLLVVACSGSKGFGVGSKDSSLTVDTQTTAPPPAASFSVSPCVASVSLCGICLALSSFDFSFSLSLSLCLCHLRRCPCRNASLRCVRTTATHVISLGSFVIGQPAVSRRCSCTQHTPARAILLPSLLSPSSDGTLGGQKSLKNSGFRLPSAERKWVSARSACRSASLP
jgi:hypothetical protein